MPSKRYARVDRDYCVACGCCVKVCPMDAIAVWHGVEARVDEAAVWAVAAARRNARQGPLNLRKGGSGNEEGKTLV